MSSNQRELLKAVYKNKTWAQRVDKMSDEQVAAIIINLRRQNKL